MVKNALVQQSASVKQSALRGRLELQPHHQGKHCGGRGGGVQRGKTGQHAPLVRDEEIKERKEGEDKDEHLAVLPGQVQAAGQWTAADWAEVARSFYKGFSQGERADDEDERREHVRLLTWLLEDKEVPMAALLQLGAEAVVVSRGPSAWGREFFAAVRRVHPEAHRRLLERRKAAAVAPVVVPTPTSGGA